MTHPFTTSSVNKLPKPLISSRDRQPVVAATLHSRLPASAAQTLGDRASKAPCRPLPSQPLVNTSPRKLTKVQKAPVHPQSPTEHYWAARALTAEALLAASAAHQRELKSVAFSEDMKKQRELAVLRKSHETRQKKVEAVIIASVACVTILTSFVIYFLISNERPKQSQSKWAMASHFTIPILSPWTSVVEHETSTFGAKTVVASVVAAACLAYAVFRYWYSHRHHR